MNKYQYVCENYKKPKPILFNTEMVRAILEGKKTQTRRLIKPQPKYYQKPNGYRVNGKYWFEDKRYKMVNECYDSYYANPPYQAGDIIYVRETFSIDENGEYVYRTNYGTTEDDSFPPTMFKWKPSIHMPKEASRIFLKVTDVRVERVQDIREKEIITEGFRDTLDGDIFIPAGLNFKKTWDEIYAIPKPVMRDKEINHYISYPWEDIQEEREYKGKKWFVYGNPWVWIIEFEKMNIEKS